jgi:hypothetical protein
MPGGRPTDELKPTLVAVRLAARQMRVLEARAKREGVGVSEALRRCLDEWAARKPSAAPPKRKRRKLTKEDREIFDQVFEAFGYKTRPRTLRRR